MPTAEKLSKKYRDTVEIQKINVDQNSELAKQFEVRSIPALFFIKDSKVIDKLNGAIPEVILREKIEAILN